jgi:hypothetical protein
MSKDLLLLLLQRMTKINKSLMSNFKFLQQEWLSLYTKMKTAEQRVYIEPVSTASYCRLALEKYVSDV